MSEPFPSTQDSEQALAYRPISGWALAGFAVSSLFALLVAVSTVVALWQGAPMFFPAWILFLAVVGIVLSGLGIWHVHTAEGTRAGAKLAQAGLWLSVISGLGYSSYYFVTGLAVQSQADDFIMKLGEDSGFFPRLEEWARLDLQGKPAGEVNSALNNAFLLTRPATDRRANPADEKAMLRTYDIRSKDGPGELSSFRAYNLFPRMFHRQPAQAVSIEALAVQNWGYEKGSYKVFRNYRIKTKELDWEMTLAVFSTESEVPGQGRKWFLNLRESGAVAKTTTEFGKGLGLLRQYARAWVDFRFLTLNNGESFADIEQQDKTPWDRLLIEGSTWQERRDFVRQSLKSSEKKRLIDFKVQGGAEDVGGWEQTDAGKIRVTHLFRFMLAKQPGQAPAYHVDGHLVVESTRAIDPTHFDLTSPPPDWTLVRIVFTGVAPIPEQKGAAPAR